MKFLLIPSLLGCCWLLAWSPAASAQNGQSQTMIREEILAAGERTAEAQIQALAGKPSIDWIGGVMWTGMMDLSAADPAHGERIVQALTEAGKAVRWTPLLNPKDPFFADDYCFGQAILDVSGAKKDVADLTPLRLRCDSLAPYLQATAGNRKLLTWWWCDALFMAPVVMVRYSTLIGDPKFVDAANAEWWKTSGALYDPEEHLFYRDERFIPPKRLSRNGKKIFWSRGNGWVAAGLARMLTYLPTNYPDRGRYLAQFREMMEKLASLQRADGTWPPSLLDPEETPASEFSGTAFFCTAMAWGINEGVLDRAKYFPGVAKAWAALLEMRRADGLPGYVQAVGDSPGKVPREATQLYATGGFCMAAAQLAKLAPFELPAPPKLTESTTVPSPVLVAP